MQQEQSIYLVASFPGYFAGHSRNSLQAQLVSNCPTQIYEKICFIKSNKWFLSYWKTYHKYHIYGHFCLESWRIPFYDPCIKNRYLTVSKCMSARWRSLKQYLLSEQIRNHVRWRIDIFICCTKNRMVLLSIHQVKTEGGEFH